jgi:hypothetical protein
MPITFVQLVTLLVALVLLMCLIDFVLSLVYKDWKLTPWEEEENAARTRTEGSQS